MTRKIVVPEGEFTFQDFCKANPSAFPLNLLKFLTHQVSLKNMTKNKAVVADVPRTTYVAISPALTEAAVSQSEVSAPRA
jgi:hypothetical protein